MTDTTTTVYETKYRCSFEEPFDNLEHDVITIMDTPYVAAKEYLDGHIDEIEDQESNLGLFYILVEDLDGALKGRKTRVEFSVSVQAKVTGRTVGA